MKLRVTDRILAALVGILFVMACAAIAAQTFFHVDVVGYAQKLFTSGSMTAKVIIVTAFIVLFALGVYFILMLFRHRGKKDQFILQKNAGGELAISVKALENMVMKCVDQHKEITVNKLLLENEKDGLLIRLRGSIAGGISIPLTVEMIQKQIKQYVTACSGVEVKGIRVQIESSDKDADDAPFAIAAPVAQPLLKEPENAAEKTEPVPAPATEEVTEPVRTEPVEAAPQIVMPPVTEEIDESVPLHQRLFKTKEEPCIVPAPPIEEDENPAEDATVSDPSEAKTAEAETQEEENETEARDETVSAGKEE